MPFYARHYYKTGKLALAVTTNLLRALCLFVQMTYFMVSRKLFPSLRSRDFPLYIIYNQMPITYRLQDPSDLAALIEIYVDREYDWSVDVQPRVIVDLGAHYGDTALYYHARYPNATIIAVEAASANFERLRMNTAGISTIYPVHAAIGDTDGRVSVAVGESSLGHSIMARNEDAVMEDVTQVTLETLLQQHAISQADIVKFDIEGAEELLCKAGKLSQLSRAYIGEIHLDLMTVDDSSIHEAFSDFAIQKILINTHRYILRAWN